MYKSILKITCCLILCWATCVPTFCQAIQAMTPDESLEARQKMIAYSKQFVGVPYLYGGASKNGMDCSGLIFTIANDAIGVKLPRSTSALYASVRVIKDSEKEPGDLVFFKTVGSKISHVGLYMGNNQFIHAASDGPNTGVIISSLKESYWSRTYAGAGRFLPAIGEQRVALSSEDDSEVISTTSAGGSSDTVVGTSTAASAGGGSTFTNFLNRVMLDGTITGDWTFFSADRFHLLFRGITVDTHARYSGDNLEPGVGVSFSYDPAMKAFKVPLLFSLTVAKNIRVYAGPMFCIGYPIEPDTVSNDSPSQVKSSIFPGVLGISFQTPNLNAGKVALSLVQDIRYTVFNNMDGAALPFINSLAAGLVFSTGIRVTFPMSNFL